MIRPIECELADKIFDILIQDCGANEMGRDQFIQWTTEEGLSKEYRFGGMFGMAGKIWLEPNGFRVSGYNRAELTKNVNWQVCRTAIDAANTRLKEL